MITSYLSLNIVAFGLHWDDSYLLYSSIDFAFDTFRNRLSSFMIELNTMANHMAKTLDDFHAIQNDSNRYNSVHNKFKTLIDKVPYCWEINENILNELINPVSFKLIYGILQTPSHYQTNYNFGLSNQSFSNTRSKDSINEKSPLTSSYNSLDQIIVHLNRDWSKNGINLRNSLYLNGIVTALLNELEPSDLYRPEVLIPGLALGRLAIELAAYGFRVEGNECSSAMISAFLTLANKILPNHIINGATSSTDNEYNDNFNNNTYKFYPHLGYSLIDDWDFEKRFIPDMFPYVIDSPQITHWVEKNPHSINKDYTSLSVQYGDFIKVYGMSNSHKERFDCIITCFFIDTAENILQYLSIISHILKKDGLWINSGPLHYHHKNAIAYSYSQLLDIIQLSGFTIVSNRIIETSYCGEEMFSMKPEYYRIPLTVFRFTNPENKIPLAY
eukprot:gene10677-14338_t